jgi:transcriptional regulator with XRE-family HTH domain
MSSKGKRQRTKSVADQLRAAIRRAERRGMTRYQIAQRSDVSEAQLSRLVHGTHLPRIDTAERMAKALGCRLVVQCEDT